MQSGSSYTTPGTMLDDTAGASTVHNDSRDGDGDFAYLSVNLTESGMEKLLRDVRPIAPFSPSDVPKTIFLWAGTANSTAPLHYDTSDNCYVQVCLHVDYVHT